LVFLTIEELGLELDSIFYSVVEDSLAEHDINPTILKHCLKFHSKEEQKVVDDWVYSICCEKVNSTIGHALLYEVIFHIYPGW
jgi:hypothetical protein